jgi:hypothetical protein
LKKWYCGRTQTSKVSVITVGILHR